MFKDSIFLSVDRSDIELPNSKGLKQIYGVSYGQKEVYPIRTYRCINGPK